jgi:stage III sporulation protein SpoIIIAA
MSLSPRNDAPGEPGLANQRIPTFAPEERKGYETEVADTIDDLLAVLPPPIAGAVVALQRQHSRGGLIEIIMDLGRQPLARFQDEEVALSLGDVTREDLKYTADRVGRFGDDNRAGIERTLHRISAIRNRSGEIVGLTCRIGRAVFGTIAIIADLIESGESVLILGRPGVGKTTMLRETARVLADDLRKRVIIVDTSNEIAGDGDIPHPAIGRARRMQVPTPTAQHGVMIEAVENHMPQVIVIDEIGTELEAMAARTIAERGVQLIGTAHGNTLENLMMNPTLADLIGGIQSVTLSDEEARRRGTQKSILERKAPPTFHVMVEIVSRDEVAVHRDVAATVDAILRQASPRTEQRRRLPNGEIQIFRAEEARRDPTAQLRLHHTRPERPERRDDRPRAEVAPMPVRVERPADATADTGDGEEQSEFVTPLLPKGRGTAQKPLRIYPFGVSRNRLESAITQLRLPAAIVRDPREADMVLTLKSYYRQKPQPIRDAELRGTSVYVLRSNTALQMEHVLSSLFPNIRRQAPTTPLREEAPEPDEVAAAMLEVEEAIHAVLEGMVTVSLAPRDSHLRKLQHALAERYNVGSRSAGREPYRRVEVFRNAD